MSVIFVVTPMVISAGWPIFTAAAAAAAGSLGLSSLAQATEKRSKKKPSEQVRGVQIDAENVESVASGVPADDSMVFGNEQLRITISRDARGRARVHVDGEGTTEELRERGQEFLNRTMQQFAYQKVAAELKRKGYTIVEEGVTEQKQIRIRFRKFEP